MHKTPLIRLKGDAILVIVPEKTQHRFIAIIEGSLKKNGSRLLRDRSGPLHKNDATDMSRGGQEIGFAVARCHERKMREGNLQWGEE